MSKNQRYFLHLTVLSVLLYFPGLGGRDFWAPVEPRYAEIARVMFENGEWLVPRVNGEIYSDKPILYFWLVLIGSAFAGEVNEWTVRLPAALGGVGFVLATYLVGRDLLSAKTGWIGATVLGTTGRVIWEARWAHVDTLFCFFFTLSIYFGARALLGWGKPHEILYAYPCMALATLAKGLIGAVLPGLIFLGFMLARRDWGLLKALRLPLGMPLYCLIAAPWFWLVNNATGGQWLRDFIYIHHLQRYTAGAGHEQPFYYYLRTLPLDFLPWTVFALPALWAYRPYGGIKRDPVALFLIAWFFAVVLFFTASDTKRDLYLMPAFPPVALFVGTYIDDLASGRIAQDAVFRTSAFIFYHLLWITALVAPAIAWWLRWEMIGSGLVPLACVLAGGVAGVAMVARRKPAALYRATALMMLATTVAASFSILPAINAYKSSRSFAVLVRNTVPESATLYVYADTMNDFNFYTRRDVLPILKSKQQVQNLLSQNEAAYMLVKDRDLKRIGTIPVERIIARDQIGSDHWNLVFLGPKLPA
ncbi:MAG TPA: glycosyltransferase family 39 protein [Candidatus Eisenbacteria bacterium]|nr:glycosyltransferase family 39 protein [Candidatus Eisenbacteria bacterium]